jgi:RimJ/RimL family protein N-acetyltransferase
MTKRSIDPINGERVRLRPLAESDLPMTLAWRNQDHIRRWFINSDLLTYEQHHGWFEQYARRDDDFVFIIEETEEMLKPVGQAAIYKIDWELQRGEFGRIFIGEPEAVGKGLAREATALILDYAFGQLRLKEVEAYILSANAASLAVVYSCGFSEAGGSGETRRVVVSAPEQSRPRDI